MIDPARILIAVVPLTLYALALAAMNLGRRPWVISGAKDTALLGIGMAGFALIGPLELFVPDGSMELYGPYLWMMLGTLYSLCVTLYILVARPSVVVYNVSIDEFHPALVRAFELLEVDATWAGNTVVLPDLGVQLHVSSFAALRNIRLSPIGENQCLSGWKHFEMALAESLKEVSVARNTRGLGFVVIGVLMILVSTLALLADQQALVQTIRTIFPG